MHLSAMVDRAAHEEYRRFAHAAGIAVESAALSRTFADTAAAALDAADSAVVRAATDTDRAVAVAFRNAMRAYVAEQIVRVERKEAKLLGIDGPGKEVRDAAREARRASEEALTVALAARRSSAVVRQVRQREAFPAPGGGPVAVGAGTARTWTFPGERVVSVTNERGQVAAELRVDPSAMERLLDRVKMPDGAKVSVLLAGDGPVENGTVEQRARYQAFYGDGELGTVPVVRRQDGSFTVVLFTSSRSDFPPERLAEMQKVLGRSLAGIARVYGGGVGRGSASKRSAEVPSVLVPHRVLVEAH
jgi:hypothetical protein